MSSALKSLSPLIDAHVLRTGSFYDSAPVDSTGASKFYRQLLGHYYRHLIPANASVLEVGCGSGELLAELPNRDLTGIDVSSRQLERARSRVPHGTFIQQPGELLQIERKFDYIVLSDTLSDATDVQALLESLAEVSHPRTRLVLNFYSSLWRPALGLATALRLKAKHPPANWLSPHDVRNLLDLAGWEVVKEQARIICPAPLLGLDRVLNRWLAPVASWLCLSNFLVARRSPTPTEQDYTVTVVVPARNEAGNIEAAVARTPDMGAGTDIIFIEGNSTDNTWDEIQRVVAAHPERKLSAMRQSGKGKGNAVREAYAAATGDILMILDADLTMPPEELPKYYNAIATGHAEYANGVRLVYPMESEAMRFLNLCGNKFFSLAFSWLLNQPIKDTLCGTKVMFREDYETLAANRSYFGDFDPFGDFDLIFGADKLNLKFCDIPIRYRDRTYGDTNIDRWRHGALLIRMTLFAARKLKFV